MAGASLALGSKALADGGTQIPAASALPLTYRQRDAHRHPDGVDFGRLDFVGHVRFPF